MSNPGIIFVIIGATALVGLGVLYGLLWILVKLGVAK